MVVLVEQSLANQTEVTKESTKHLNGMDILVFGGDGDSGFQLINHMKH